MTRNHKRRKKVSKPTRPTPLTATQPYILAAMRLTVAFVLLIEQLINR